MKFAELSKFQGKHERNSNFINWTKMREKMQNKGENKVKEKEQNQIIGF